MFSKHVIQICELKGAVDVLVLLRGCVGKRNRGCSDHHDDEGHGDSVIPGLTGAAVVVGAAVVTVVEGGAEAAVKAKYGVCVRVHSWRIYISTKQKKSRLPLPFVVVVGAFVQRLMQSTTPLAGSPSF